MISPETRGAVLKVAGPLVAIGVLLIVLRLRRRPIRKTLAVERPRVLPALAWLGLYVAYMLLTNLTMDWRGPWDFAPWRAAPLAESVLRVLAVCVLGPIAEELIFRGAMFTLLQKRLPVSVVIGITAAVWAAIHVNYEWPVILLLFGSGVLLGLARWRTASVLPPIAMHMLWNFYAIW